MIELVPETVPTDDNPYGDTLADSNEDELDELIKEECDALAVELFKPGISIGKHKDTNGLSFFHKFWLQLGKVEFSLSSPMVASASRSRLTAMELSSFTPVFMFGELGQKPASSVLRLIRRLPLDVDVGVISNGINALRMKAIKTHTVSNTQIRTNLRQLNNQPNIHIPHPRQLQSKPQLRLRKRRHLDIRTNLLNIKQRSQTRLKPARSTPPWIPNIRHQPRRIRNGGLQTEVEGCGPREGRADADTIGECGA